jgi:hypothetical protein
VTPPQPAADNYRQESEPRAVSRFPQGAAEVYKPRSSQAGRVRAAREVAGNER